MTRAAKDKKTTDAAQHKKDQAILKEANSKFSDIQKGQAEERYASVLSGAIANNVKVSNDLFTQDILNYNPHWPSIVNAELPKALADNLHTELLSEINSPESLLTGDFGATAALIAQRTNEMMQTLPEGQKANFLKEMDPVRASLMNVYGPAAISYQKNKHIAESADVLTQLIKSDNYTIKGKWEQINSLRDAHDQAQYFKDIDAQNSWFKGVVLDSIMGYLGKSGDIVGAKQLLENIKVGRGGENDTMFKISGVSEAYDRKVLEVERNAETKRKDDVDKEKIAYDKWITASTGTMYDLAWDEEQGFPAVTTFYDDLGGVAKDRLKNVYEALRKRVEGGVEGFKTIPNVLIELREGINLLRTKEKGNDFANMLIDKASLKYKNNELEKSDYSSVMTTLSQLRADALDEPKWVKSPNYGEYTNQLHKTINARLTKVVIDSPFVGYDDLELSLLETRRLIEAEATAEASDWLRAEKVAPSFQELRIKVDQITLEIATQVTGLDESAMVKIRELREIQSQLYPKDGETASPVKVKVALPQNYKNLAAKIPTNGYNLVPLAGPNGEKGIRYETPEGQKDIYE